MKDCYRAVCLIAIGATVAARTARSDPPPVDFAAQIQPIFSRSCAKCHGADKQSGQLRLDVRAAVLAGGVSGPVILPGRSSASPLVKLLLSPDPEDRMPRKSAPLPRAEIDLIRAWIDQGAKGSSPAEDREAPARAAAHWAYVKPTRPTPPAVSRQDWVRNPVDAFILARLDREKLAPAPEAPRETLIRRLSLDLVGLPPSLEDVEAFLADRRPDAYERLVDRLLASPHHGERWARVWLDLARYADSNGYEQDGRRTMWKYRDWIIRAFNQDMPFDRFTIEQLAGDMLPNPTTDTLIASGFHANTMVNEECGVDPNEARFLVLADRVNTTAEVWLGSTMACAQCHNHKYDPFSQKDYYALLAFFDNGPTEIPRVPGCGAAIRDRTLRLPTPEQAAALATLEARIAERRRVLDTQTPALDQALAGWLADIEKVSGGWQPVDILRATAKSGAKIATAPDHSLRVSGPSAANDTYTIVARQRTREPVVAFRLEALPDEGLPDGGPGRGPRGGFVVSEVKVALARGNGDPVTVPLLKAFADVSGPGGSVADAIDGRPETGWSVDAKHRPPFQAIFTTAPVALGPDARLIIALAHDTIHPRHTLGRFRLSATAVEGSAALLTMPVEMRALVARTSRSADEQRALGAYFRSVTPLLEDVRKEIAALQKKIDALGIPTALVMTERASFERPSTPLRVRGSFTSPGPRVYANVPAALPPLPESEAPNRLGLARWLVGSDNPLTTRVTVNRLWEQYFGRGIVETSEDFGTQGAAPSHPDLLDWLATELPARGWSLKHLHRLIVTSATYRQSSRVTPALLERDPSNRLLARAPRFRVEAEMVRDVILESSGLLARAIGGPSVFPPQPDGVWNVATSGLPWVTSSGSDRHRRSLYTFWRRSAPYPMLTTFDATSREVCTLRRVRTNTPLQALNLLNDPALFEAAGALAKRMLARPADNVRTRVARGFRLCTARPPRADELDRLVALVVEERRRGRPDLGAWTLLANTLLNLDETLTKE